MDTRTYNRIYENLNTPEDIEKFDLPKEVLLSILSQKHVRKTRNNYYKIKNKSEDIKNRWLNGESVTKIAEIFDFSPVLIASIVLNELEFNKKESKRFIKDPSLVLDKRLRREIKEAVKEDFIYSPNAHKDQIKRSKLGEEIIKEWLISKNADFITEKEALKNGNSKTPDFIINPTICIDGRKISWIDSKVVFGDKIEHKRHLRKQFSHYLELFGDGLVVYWYGFVDDIKDCEPGIIVKDFKYFNAKPIKE